MQYLRPVLVLLLACLSGAPASAVPAPRDVVMYEVNLRAFSQAGDLAGAREWSLRACSAFPWNPAPRQRLAEIEFDLGNRAESARIMDGLVAEFPWSEPLARRRDELLALARGRALVRLRLKYPIAS